MEKKTNTIYALLTISVLVIFTVLLFWDLGSTHLANWDEAWNADISRNIATTGNLLTPIWNSEPFFDKPPLYFWFSALFFKIIGDSELSARLISAAFGLGVLIVTYSLGRLLFNRDAAIMSITILCSTIGFLYRSRTGNLDVLLTFWILLTIFAFFKGLREKKQGWFITMGISTALGFLTKGAIAFLFPAFALFYILPNKEFRHVLKGLLRAIFIGSTISVAWLTASLLVNGQDFLAAFFTNQAEKWLPTNLRFWESFSFSYMEFLKHGLKFWFILFIPAYLFTLYRWYRTINVLLVAYFSLVFIVLSFSENKSDWFLVPLYPIISLMIGFSISQVTKKIIRDKSILVVAFLLLVAIGQIIFYNNQFNTVDIAADEARVAMAAKRVTREDDLLYLTNYYVPTTVYYSERMTFAVYSEHEVNSAWWIKPKSQWDSILGTNRVFIITTAKELEELKNGYPTYDFEIIYQSGEKLLVKKV